MRVDFDPTETDPHTVHRLLTSTVTPRPIAWISTTSEAGIDNLAPHSFFNIASVLPPVLQFESVGRKDTLTNIEANGEFVVNLAPEPLFEKINATATDFPPDMSEFDEVGIEREPSAKVKPPRVADSPVSFECQLHSTVFLGSGTVVFGRVVHVAVSESVMEEGHPDVNRLRPLARLGKDEWCTVGEVLSIPRIAYKDWPTMKNVHRRP
ncbi:flavin reductase family protein [Streptomyces monashensis]|uniref:Flavin reductase n=1 Tax=Streptomyces monashensis TaxID=1678012 RepID=A0A1S2PR75_9ACTN|nr:flavin reductase family protein [Streptomyces monashensis]OIJ96318.1 flavin reductase [Streptomyces monashensis]